MITESTEQNMTEETMLVEASATELQAADFKNCCGIVKAE